jgi:hypothetical protein
MTNRRTDVEQMTRDFLAKHDSQRPIGPRAKLRMKRWQAHKKANKQHRMQERGLMATPLLKGVE